jgi:hypothetical protein
MILSITMWGTFMFSEKYISFTLIVSPFLQVVSFCRLFFFPFCIKEEYKTNDSSTNRVADQQYIVKQNVHEFSIKSFLLSKSCSEPFYIAFFYYISFMFCRCSIFGNFPTVTRRVPSFFKSHTYFCL